MNISSPLPHLVLTALAIAAIAALAATGDLSSAVLAALTTMGGITGGAAAGLSLPKNASTAQEFAAIAEAVLPQMAAVLNTQTKTATTTVPAAPATVAVPPPE